MTDKSINASTGQEMAIIHDQIVFGQCIITDHHCFDADNSDLWTGNWDASGVNPQDSIETA